MCSEPSVAWLHIQNYSTATVAWWRRRAHAFLLLLHTEVWSTSETSRAHDHQACQAPIRLKRLNLTTPDPIFSLRLSWRSSQESRHSRVACHSSECSLYLNSGGICRDVTCRHVDGSTGSLCSRPGGRAWLVEADLTLTRELQSNAATEEHHDS